MRLLLAPIAAAECVGPAPPSHLIDRNAKRPEDTLAPRPQLDGRAGIFERAQDARLGDRMLLAQALVERDAEPAGQMVVAGPNEREGGGGPDRPGRPPGHRVERLDQLGGVGVLDLVEALPT